MAAFFFKGEGDNQFFERHKESRQDESVMSAGISLGFLH